MIEVGVGDEDVADLELLLDAQRLGHRAGVDDGVVVDRKRSEDDRGEAARPAQHVHFITFPRGPAVLGRERPRGTKRPSL